MVNARSASGAVLQACDRREVVLLLSRPAMTEYRAILRMPYVVAKYPELSREKVEWTLRRLRFVADVVNCSSTHFEFPRDPKDAKWIELCIAGDATHLITADNDLLSLQAGRDDASKRFRQRLPHLKILEPVEFMKTHRPQFG
jgi:putative PIN family toxin of toxin-antitoxin system